MTPLPGALGGKELIVWRLETRKYFATWEMAEGAFRVGGRWSSAGRRVLYTSIDPATAILEVGVHKGFDTLDTVPHTLIEIEIPDPAKVHVIQPAAIPNPNWLRTGTVGRGQQAFGDALLASHAFVVVPSVVSTRSWNLLIDVTGAAGLFSLRGSDAFALNTRLTSVVAAKHWSALTWGQRR